MTEPVQADVRTVQRAYSLVSLLGRTQTELTLSQLARSARLPISTVSRLISSLVQTGLVDRTEYGTYRSGAHLARLGLEALQRYKAFRLSDRHLVSLVKASGETASLAVRVNKVSAIYLRQVPGPRALLKASWASRSVPLSSTASGTALLGKLGRRLYAVKLHQKEIGFTAIASPVRDASGEIVAALCIAGPTARISEERIARLGGLVSDQALDASKEIQSWGP